MPRILVIDLGTSYFKVSVVEPDGRLDALVRVEVPIQKGLPDRCQLDAEVFRRSLADAVGQLHAKAHRGLSDVAAVTFASQTNSFLLLDGNDRPLTPLILWPDRRAVAQQDAMRDWSNRANFTAQTGIPRASHQFMAAKLLWLRHEQPDTWRRTRRLCLISDYMTLLLTGRHVTEGGAAGLTGLVDIHALRFCDDALGRFHLSDDWLPSVVRAGTDLGPIDPQAAEWLGLPRACRFVVGCLDQYAGAIGVGVTQPGAVSETTGTVLATVRCSDGFTSRPGSVFQGPAFAPGIYYEMVFGEVSANYLDWYRRQLPDAPPFDALIALAAHVEPGADGLRLCVDAPPATLDAVFDRRRPSHHRGHFVRCILEAVAVALRDQVLCLSHEGPPDEIRCAGGGAGGRPWLQIKADMLGVPMRATHCAEPTSLGAAILANAALTGTAVGKVAEHWVRAGDPCPADPANHRRYQVLYPIVPTPAESGAPAD